MNNICKFITEQHDGELRASSFIFESRVAHSGKELALDEHAMYLVSGGAGFYRTAGKTAPLSPGTLFFSFFGVPFTITSSGGLEYFRICFSGERADELLRRFGATPAACVFTGLDGLIPLWRESLTRGDGETLDLLSESMALYTFSKLKSCASAENETVARVVDRLESGFSDPGLTLASVAGELGYNVKYLSRLFKTRFGVGFAEYLRTLRLRQGVTLIENGVTSVGNVARLCGYSDPLYFSRVFKKQFGVSPKEYKKR